MQVQSIATQPDNSLSSSQGGIKTLSTLDAACLIIISLVILAAIAAPFYAYILKLRQLSLSVKLRPKVPCYRCRYFSGNPYLQCALHPVTVLTEQTVDCIDYSPK